MAENKIQVTCEGGLSRSKTLLSLNTNLGLLCAGYLSPPDKYESAQPICKEHLGNGYQ